MHSIPKQTPAYATAGDSNAFARRSREKQCAASASITESIKR